MLAGIPLVGLPTEIDHRLAAPAVAVLTFMAGAALYRLAVRSVLAWAFAADDAGARAAVRRLAWPYYIVVLLLALNFGRAFLEVPVPAAADAWLRGLLGPAIAVLIIEAGRVTVVDLVLTSRQKVAVPGILRDLALGLVYLTVALVFASTVFKVDLTPVLTLSGLMSLVLGLALQDTLGNLFAGLAINLEKPFAIGDWVSIDGGVGQVKEITWRATKFRTLLDELIVVPNNVIARGKIINYMLPTPVHAHVVTVGVSYGVPPEEAKAAIGSCLEEVEGILAEPPPVCWLSGFGESAIDYDICVWVDDFERVPFIKDDLRSRLWYKFQQRDIEIPWPIRSIYMRDDSRARERELERKLETIKSVDFLSALDEAERRELAEVARLARFQQGERIFRQHDPGDSLFIIAEGQVELFIGSDDATHQLAVLDEGKFFGEMALLTGEPRTASAKTVTACELVVLAKRDLDLLFRRRPEVTERIAQIVGEHKARTELARRTLEQELETRVARAEAEKTVVEQTSRELFGRIRAFFKLT